MRVLCLDHHPEPSFNELKAIDAIEWRLDAPNTSIKQFCTQNQQWKKPWILTHRRKKEGGWFEGPDQSHRQKIIDALTWGPTWVDIEYDQPESFLKHIKVQYPDIKIIRSRHDMHHTPSDLQGELKKLQHPLAHSLKWVTKAQKGLDGIRMLKLSQLHPNLTAFCLGEKGRFTRELAPKWGSNDYLCYREAVAEGQLSLSDRINLPVLQTTACYAVIGCPIAHSLSPIWHRMRFRIHKKNAVYTSIELTKDDTTAQQLLWDLRFQGLSITMPLKSVWAEQASKPMNTYAWTENGWRMRNTDSVALMELFSRRQFKKILVLGAGATGSMCLKIIKKMGYYPALCHYQNDFTQQKAQELDVEWIHWNALDELDRFECIISTLPFHVDHTLWEKQLTRNQFYLNLNYLHIPKTKAQIISGLDFFQIQAQKQQDFWNSSDEVTC